MDAHHRAASSAPDPAWVPRTSATGRARLHLGRCGHINLAMALRRRESNQRAGASLRMEQVGFQALPGTRPGGRLRSTCSRSASRPWWAVSGETAILSIADPPSTGAERSAPTSDHLPVPRDPRVIGPSISACSYVAGLPATALAPLPRRGPTAMRCLVIDASLLSIY